MAARGHHLFPLRVHYYTSVGALLEAPANDIGLRSCLCQSKDTGLVYYLLSFGQKIWVQNCVSASSRPPFLSKQSFACYLGKSPFFPNHWSECCRVKQWLCRHCMYCI